MHKEGFKHKAEEVNSTFAALRFPNFRLFWLASFASHIGFQMQNVGINWHIYGITKSPLSLGLIGLVTFLPLLFFSLIGGVAADKFSRKKIMMVCQLVNFLSSFVLAYMTHAGLISPYIIYVAIAANATVLSFDLPSRQALLPSLVPSGHFVNAVSLATLVRQIAIIVGPPIAGFLIAFSNVEAVYFVNIIAFMFSALALLFISEPQKEERGNVTLSLTSILEGIRFVKERPIIYSTMLLDFAATFFSAATVLLPIFAQDILQTGPKGLGLLYAAPSVGGVVAGIIISSLGNIGKQGKLLIAGVLLYGTATIAFGLSKSFALSLFFLALVGAGDMLSTVIRNTIRQVLTPDALRGRMVSINMIFFAGGPQLGEVEAGFLAAAIGTPISVAVGGIATIILTATVAMLVPKLWRYEKHQ